MIRNEIFEMLTSIIGPLKSQSQTEDSNFDKFQQLLMQALTQPALEFRKSGVEFPGLQTHMLPEEVSDELENMAGKIIAQQANRQPGDPVYWLRQRDVPVAAGIEESIENFVEPAFSFGPFLNQELIAVWFDFFQVSKQLKFQVLNSKDFLIITIPGEGLMPGDGRHKNLSFDDCTIWVSVTSVSNQADKRYVGVRAKKCDIQFSGIAQLLFSQFVSVISEDFQITFQPFDKFENGLEGNALAKALYPDNIIFNFTGTKWSLQSFDRSGINLNGDSIEFDRSDNIQPVFLEAENLIHFPLAVNKESWEINNNDTERFSLDGKAGPTD
ncbi:MAG: hypothetical protein ABIN25_01905, partial [Ginsengibacter sp.]